MSDSVNDDVTDAADVSTESLDTSVKEKYDYDEEFPEFEGWEMIGFHRPLGSQMWEFTLEIVTALVGILTISLFVEILYPFPEITGYQDAANTVFAVATKIFDAGVGYGIGRFIAEYRVKNIEKMLMYIRFYIWYQLFSGTLQITIISVVIFKMTVYSDFSYLVWLILFGLSKQWPGMLGVFKTTIGGLQHFDKTNILKFLQGQVFEQITRFAFVLLGRWYGTTNPEVGLILGMALGYAIGSYLDDIFITFVAIHYLKKILRPMGFTLRDLVVLKVDKDVMKQSVFYGIQNSIYPIVDAATRTLVFVWYYSAIPALTTWTALAGVSSGIAGVVNTFGSFSLTNSIAESYSNGKKELAEWYVTVNIKWRYFFTTVFVVALVALIPFLNTFLNETPALEYYKAAMVFFIPHLVVKYLDPFKQLPDYIYHGCLYITQFNILRLIEEAIEVAMVYLWIFVLNIQDMGMFGIIFLVGLKTRPSVLVKTIMAYVYIQKKILTVRVAWYASLVIPLLAALPILIVSPICYYLIFIPLLEVAGIIVATIVGLLVMVFGGVLLTYFPLTGVLGWWSDYELFNFEKAMSLSGPSKPIFRIAYKLIIGGVNIGKKLGLHGKYSIDHEVAIRQIGELLEMKRKQHRKLNSKNEQ